MTTAIEPAAIDAVLRDAVASGAVPHVAAIAADRDGVIYQGAAGPRAGRTVRAYSWVTENLMNLNL